MGRARVVGALVGLLLVAGSGAARAELLQDLGATFDQVARDLQGTFPKVECRIVDVTGTEVRLAGSGVAALRPGLELLVYRRGEVFRHPVTGQPLGRAEEEVATLTVIGVTGEEARARVAATDAGRVPVVGDGARITAGRMPVAVLPPLGVTVPGETADQTALLLVSRFSALLEKTGRFLAVDPTQVVEAATPAEGAPPPGPLQVAGRLKAPAVLTSRLVQEGRSRILETAWLSARTGATLAAARTPLVKANFPPRFAWEETPELERRFALEGPVRALAIADVDGDGRPELIVADDRVVTISRWQEGVGLLPLAGGEYRPPGSILSLDAADINGSGRPQIVVVEYRGGGQVVHSTVLEFAGERFRTLYETGNRFLRVIQVGKESWLVEQAVGTGDPFDPAVRRLLWRDGRYRAGEDLAVPKGVSVYGLALMRLTGSPDPEFVALTAEDRLVVWTARGRRLWTSPDVYGGATVTFPWSGAPGPDRVVKEEALIGRIRGRLLPLGEAPEGPEVLVFANQLAVAGPLRTFLPNLAPLAFTQGRIHRLRWTSGGFVRVWQSRPTEGYIADYGYGDLDGDGTPEVTVAVVPRGLNLAALNPAGRPKAELVLYELP